MVESRHTKILLRQVEVAIKKPPSRSSLTALLTIGDPDFTEAGLDEVRKRESCFRQLKLLIHPDKLARGREATQRYQEAQNFYDKCIACLHIKSKKRKISLNRRRCSAQFPHNYHVKETWTFFEGAKFYPKERKPSNIKNLEAFFAFRCINMRGAIAHGKRTELSFQHYMKSTSKTVEGAFGVWGGSKCLDDIDDIKEELLKFGPLVSTSFVLTKTLYKAYKDRFCASRIGKRHPVIIVGWCREPNGEFWIIQGTESKIYDNDKSMKISMSQFALDDEVFSPSNSFINHSWQKKSLAFDLPFSNDDWYTWTKMRKRLSNEELDALFEVLGCSWATAISERKQIVIRDKLKRARSRYAYIKDIEWSKSEKKWLVNYKFCDKEWEE